MSTIRETTTGTRAVCTNGARGRFSVRHGDQTFQRHIRDVVAIEDKYGDIVFAAHTTIDGSERIVRSIDGVRWATPGIADRDAMKYRAVVAIGKF